MRETIMLLSHPSTGLDVVNTGNASSPVRLQSHLIEFAVLNHHGVDDTQETLITGEDTSTTNQCVTLQEALAGMF